MICSTTWMGYMANRWHRWSSEYISIYSAELARDPNHPRVPRVPQFGTNLPFLLVGSCFTSLITVGSDGFLFSNRTWPWQVEQHCLVSPKVLYPSRSSIAKSPFIYIYILYKIGWHISLVRCLTPSQKDSSRLTISIYIMCWMDYKTCLN